MQINLNIRTQAVLTNEGAQVYNTYYADAPAKHRPALLAAGDRIAVPLWEAMAVFGPAIQQGALPMFADNCIDIGD